MAGWLRGVVKEVPAGDTIVIGGAIKGNAPPPEKRLTLASIMAPKLVSSVAGSRTVLPSGRNKTL